MDHAQGVTVLQGREMILLTFEGADARLAWRLRDDNLACGEVGVAGAEPRLSCGRWRMMRQATETMREAISRAAEGKGEGFEGGGGGGLEGP
jgi:hypothetical protein